MNGLFMNRNSSMPHLFLLAGFVFPLIATSQSSTQTIVFHNLDKKEGKIYIAWYNKGEDFTKKDKIHLAKVVEARNTNTVKVAFENILPGTYAIAAFFDQNGNGIMDTNFFGIPKNVRPMTPANTFKEASVKMTGKENTISIKLK